MYTCFRILCMMVVLEVKNVHKSVLVSPHKQIKQKLERELFGDSFSEEI